MGASPTISIVTPSFNGGRRIRRALESVAAQGYPNVDHIIIDGGSTDDTREIVKSYPAVRFYCEPDRGMYDALNKGLNAAIGEIIGLLNTDDFYADQVFMDVAATFEDQSVMAVAGRAVVFCEQGGGDMEIVDRYSPQESALLESSTIGSNYFNAWFFRRSVFERIGRFNTSYRIAGDREFMLRFAFGKMKYVSIDKVTYMYLQHDGSLTFGKSDPKLEQSACENLEIADLYLNKLDLSRSEKKLLIHLRTTNSIELAVRSLAKLKMGDAVFFAVKGIRYDILWIPRFFSFVLWNVAKSVPGFRRSTSVFNKKEDKVA